MQKDEEVGKVAAAVPVIIGFKTLLFYLKDNIKDIIIKYIRKIILCIFILLIKVINE